MNSSADWMLFKCRRGRVAPLGVARERRREHRVEVAAEPPVVARQRGRVIARDRADGVGERVRVRVERSLPGQQLVAQHAERVDVGAGVDGRGVGRGDL